MSFAQFAGTFGATNLNSNPLFVRANPADYASPGLFSLKLQSGSPARGFGTPTGAPTDDLTRSARTFPPDAGAYSFTASAGGRAPSAPTNLRIIR